ncbi:beta-lactamase family protein [bacterium]|nr:beta-lactamase family protein [bacterium]
MKNLFRTMLYCIVCGFSLAALSWGQGLPSAAPGDVGFSPERLNRIAPVMQQYVDQNRIAGCLVLVARHGKVAYFKEFGMSDKEAGKPMKSDAIFRIASMSKPVTATAVMMLYEEGRFLLSDPVSKYIPEFRNMQVLVADSGGGSMKLVPATREITIRMLLNHTSGITYGGGKLSDYYTKAGISTGLRSEDGTIGDMVKKLAGLPLNHNPGDEWAYGLSQDVLGYFVEVVSGMPFDRFLEERIFKPLGMKDTCFFPPEAKLPRVATLYIKNKEGGIDRQKPEDARALYYGPRKYFSGGGGLHSTVSDYARFAQMLLNGGELDGVRLLSRKSVELMTSDSTGGIDILGDSPDTRATHGDRYGLGLGIHLSPADMESSGTFGWGGAFHTLFWVDPKEDLIGIFMSQLGGEGDKSQHRKLNVLVYQAIID